MSNSSWKDSASSSSDRCSRNPWQDSMIGPRDSSLHKPQFGSNSSHWLLKESSGRRRRLYAGRQHSHSLKEASSIINIMYLQHGCQEVCDVQQLWKDSASSSSDRCSRNPWQDSMIGPRDSSLHKHHGKNKSSQVSRILSILPSMSAREPCIWETSYWHPSALPLQTRACPFPTGQKQASRQSTLGANWNLGAFASHKPC